MKPLMAGRRTEKVEGRDGIDLFSWQEHADFQAHLAQAEFDQASDLAQEQDQHLFDESMTSSQNSKLNNSKALIDL